MTWRSLATSEGANFCFTDGHVKWMISISPVYSGSMTEQRVRQLSISGM